MQVLDKNKKIIDAEVIFHYKGYEIHIVSYKENDEPEIYALLDGEDCVEANLHPDDEKTKPWTSVDDALSWIDEDKRCRDDGEEPKEETTKLTIEKIYECRRCKQTINVIEEIQNMSKDIPKVIFSQNCKNCCLPNTNNAVMTVVADLRNYIVVEK